MARTVFLSRLAVVATSAAALACSLRAPDVSFITAVRFQQISLVVLLLFWHLPRLVYDAARVFAGVPLPPSNIALIALVVAEGVVMAVLFAAASSATAVLVFFKLDTRSCVLVRAFPGAGACSHWLVAAAALNLAAWIFSAVVSWLMFCLGVVEAELA